MGNTSKIRVCVAGATGWTGSAVVAAVLKSERFELVGAVSRKAAGQEIGGVLVTATVEEALRQKTDVLVDYTKPDVVKSNAAFALKNRVAVVIGTSGLSAKDYLELESIANESDVGLIAAGNFSITAALAKHFSLIAAQYLPHREIIDYASATKIDAPSGTVRELAEQLALVRKNEMAVPIEKVTGYKEARGLNLEGTPVHSIRLPSYVISFETLFGLPNERLTIRHDASTGADPYVAGTMLAVERVISTKGMIRGLDNLLFSKEERK